MVENKTFTLFNGEYRNYLSDTRNKIQDELLFFIKKKGLTVNQAIELLKNTIEIIGDYSAVLSIEEFEKITGRKVTDGLHQ